MRKAIRRQRDRRCDAPVGRVRREWHVALSVAALGVAASACGGSSAGHRGAIGPLPVLGIVHQAVSVTRDAGSAQVALAVGVGGTSKAPSPVGTGVADLKNGITTLSSSFSQQCSGAKVTIQSIQTVDALYTSIPAGYTLPGETQPISSYLPGKKWIEYSSPAGAGASTPNQAFLDNEVYNVSWLLASLQGIVGPVAKVGKASAAGIPATEYRVRIDLPVAGRAAGSSLGRVFTEESAFLGSVNDVRSLPAEVWIGSGGRVVELALQVVFPSGVAESAKPGSHHSPATVELYLRSFGTAVPNVSVPAASTVATAQQVAAAVPPSSSAKSGSCSSSSSPPSTSSGSPAGAGSTATTHTGTGSPPATGGG